jgi:hypothetical protein
LAAIASIISLQPMAQPDSPSTLAAASKALSFLPSPGTRLGRRIDGTPALGRFEAGLADSDGEGVFPAEDESTTARSAGVGASIGAGGAGTAFFRRGGAAAGVAVFFLAGMVLSPVSREPR